MPERSLETLLEGGSFFEGPRWHDGRWWVSDFYRARACCRDDRRARRGGRSRSQGQPSGLGWMPDGSLLVVSMRDHRILRRVAGRRVTQHADVSEHCGGHLNDMVVDAPRARVRRRLRLRPHGRRRPGPGGLIRVDPDGTRHRRRRGAAVPERLGHHPGRADAHRRRDRRRPLHRVHDPGRRLADRPAVWAQVAATPPITTLAGDARPAEFGARRLHAGRRGAHLGRRRGRRALRARGARRRRSSTRSRAPGGPGRLRLHARRRRRPNAADVRRAGLPRARPQRRARGGAAGRDGRRSARRACPREPRRKARGQARAPGRVSPAG